MKLNENKTLGNMTVGNPAKLIIKFSIPLLIGNIFQQLYNMVDSIVVGNYVGKIALAAVGTSFPIVFMLISFFMGLGIGATILIAQFYGANDYENVRKTSQTIYTSFIFLSVPLTIIGICLSGTILRIVNVPADTFELANIYMKIIFAGMIGTMGYNINAGILQGLGDSKSSLIFLAISCVINIILDLVFVLVFHMGVAGVAFATIIAQIISWLLGIAYIFKKYEFLRFPILKFGFDKELFKKIFKLGLPTGIQQTIFSFGILNLQSLINSYGSDFIAGFNAANKIDTFAFMPVQSFATAVTTYVGQNIGANRYDRVHKGVISTIIMSLALSGIMILIVLPLGPTLLKLFNQEPAVIDAGMAYLSRVLPFFVILAVMFVLNSTMRGAGEAIIPMISTTISLWLARIPCAYYIANNYGRDNLFYCFAIGWIVGLIISTSYYMTGRWKNKSVVK